MDKNTKRVDTFDLLKGIAIFLVVMGHVLTMCIRDIDSSVAFKLIGEVHMPVFFFISGYFTYKTSTLKSFVAPNLKRRFLQLMVPFFVVSSLWITYFPHSGLQSPLSSNIPDMLMSYWKDGYWFTLTLFELMLVYALLSRLFCRIRSGVQQVIVSVVVYGLMIVVVPLLSDAAANFDPLGVGLLARFYPVFMFGVFARKYSALFDRTVVNSWTGVMAVAVFFVSWYYSAYTWKFPNLSEGMLYVAQPLLHASLMVLVMGLAKSATPSEPSKPGVVKRWFLYLGNNSLAIYLLHYFFLFPLTPLQEPLRMLDLAFVPLMAVSAFFAFFIVAATLGANYVIGKNRILSLLMIGK